MQFIIAFIMFICSLFGFNQEPQTAKSWAYQDPETGIIYTQENPEGVDTGIGSAIWLNPETNMYETSDGLSWPAN